MAKLFKSAIKSLDHVYGNLKAKYDHGSSIVLSGKNHEHLENAISHIYDAVEELNEIE